MLLLFSATIGDFSYGYYVFVRLVSAIMCFLLAYLYYSIDRAIGLWVFLIAGIIFQPIFKIHLTKEIWQVLDGLLAIAIFFGTLNYIQTRKSLKYQKKKINYKN